MKLFSLLLLFFSTSAFAEGLTNVKIDCWHKGVDDGAFLCQFVMVMGNRSSDQSFVIPALAAPDQGGPKTWEQADLACKEMGFLHSVAFELDDPKNEKLQVTLSESGAYLAPLKGRFVQHLGCE